jgi:hypothetical protein
MGPPACGQASSLLRADPQDWFARGVRAACGGGTASGAPAPRSQPLRPAIPTCIAAGCPRLGFTWFPGTPLAPWDHAHAAGVTNGCPSLPALRGLRAGKRLGGGAAPGASAAFVTFRRWIPASRRIGGIPVPSINREARINRDNRKGSPACGTPAVYRDGCDGPGAGRGGDHTRTVASMLSRRAGRAMAQLARSPLPGLGCIAALAGRALPDLPGMRADYRG